MRKALTVLTALPLIFGSAVGNANATPFEMMAVAAAVMGPGHPLMKGLSGPEELADLIVKSLTIDPSGNRRLDQKRCDLNGSCATPNDYLLAIKTWHPNVGLQTVDQLARYVRSLKKEQVIGGKYLSARMVQINGVWKLDLKSGFTRPLMRGEYAWVDMQTGDVIMLEYCGNVAQFIMEDTPIQSNCRYIEVPKPPGTVAVRVLVVGSRPLDDEGCTTSIKPAGATEYRHTVDECPDETCNFAEAKAYAAQREGLRFSVESVKGSWATTENGIDVFKTSADVEKGFLVVFCVDIKMPDGSIKHRIYRSKNVVGQVYDARGHVTLPAWTRN